MGELEFMDLLLGILFISVGVYRIRASYNSVYAYHEWSKKDGGWFNRNGYSQLLGSLAISDGLLVLLFGYEGVVLLIVGFTLLFMSFSRDVLYFKSKFKCS